MKRHFVVAAALLVASFAAHATYNANIVGNVSQVLTYTSGGLLFALSNQPTSNGTCNATFFELEPSDAVSDAAFNRMYARLAEAYALGQAVNIGFDNAGNCSASGYIRVYRIG